MMPRILLSAALLALCACASSPEVTYYRLEPLPPAAGSNHGGPVLGVGPLQFPEYLRRPQMVTRDGSARMRVDDFHRWVDALDRDAVRTLAANLDALLPDLVAVPVLMQPAFVMAYQLDGNVVRFEADSGNRVELVVQWRLRALADGDWIAPPRTARYTARADAGTPAAIAAAMADALGQFSRDVAAALDQGTPSDHQE